MAFQATPIKDPLFAAAQRASCETSANTVRMAPVLVDPENFFTRVWHRHCPKRGPMRRERETLTIEDGAVLRLFTCMGCQARCFAGLDAGRYVVTRPAPGDTWDESAKPRGPWY